MKKNKDNPHVSFETCNLRHEGINKRFDGLDGKMNEIIKILTGSGEIDEMGLVGEVRDIKRDRKWIYTILTIFGIPLIFLIVQFVLKG